MSSRINEDQKRILDVFKYLQSVLEKHGLKSVCCCGTVLGAVRHKGFIPWDDDIDIYMPREDYEKFLKLKSEVCKDGYEIVSDADEGYYLPYAKIIDKRTTLWEVKELPFLLGTFVDVFPLDSFDLEDDQIEKIQAESLRLFQRYVCSLKKISFAEILGKLFCLKYASFKTGLKSKLISSKRAYREFCSYKQKYICLSGKKSVCLTQEVGKIFKTEWFENVIDFPFEDVCVKIPADYDGYLKCLYGDYMTLPSEEKRVSNHYHYFEDYTRRLTIDEVKKIKNGKSSG